ncbi:MULTISPECIES: alanine/glycine:cation symporter family protein [Pseudonocardia]|jgi:AGCS family alanine or glycine:cation symporter|nr:MULTISPECIES: alanine/glycine:cation symporter family protein [unclassified Pseudonocardia]MCO7195132.1 alanine:cation symporter family protein [Pseudonocardia sp. McavD-2-B]MYW76049.1 amino acid carrier protein [Pseudonocardia sp. SID8383]OJG07336.1 Amino-acid carrier protein AlsT [Pseudonocardia autotrophica]
MTSVPTSAPPQPGVLESIELSINSVFDPISTGLSNIVFYEVTVLGADFPLIVGWLILAGVLFTLYFGFVQFRSIGLALRIVRGRYTRRDEPGEITHFQALASALSGTVGLGNIAGVGVAVTIGGPGATFWMIVAGLLSMATKFVECTLGVKYRDVHPDGTVSGGPMHYLRIGVAERIPNAFGRGLGKVLAAGAAVMILFFGVAGGNMFQANQTFAQLRNVTGGETGLLGSGGAAFVFGLLLAALVGAVVFGGIKSVGAVTGRLVPAMAIVYVTACLLVIAVNIAQVPTAFGLILSGAFSAEGVVGGALGAMIVGFQRAAFSNEAGLGSSPIAHSAVRTKNPATEGYVALIEPFVDTVVICTMTALTIVIAGTPFWQQAQATAFASGGSDVADGVLITSDAFATVLPWFPYVLAVAVFLFAVSTIITWGYYGQKAWTYLFGRNMVSERVYQVIFCFFVVVGSVLTLGSVLDFADAVLFLLAFFNILGLYVLAPVVKKEVREFRAKLASGEVAEVEPSERAML